MIKLLCVGKKTEAMFTPALSHYQKRIENYVKFELITLPHSTQSETIARTQESDFILAKLRPNDMVVLFDERGATYTSEQLAKHLEAARNQSRDVVCIIGGSYGVSDELREHVDVALSFGDSVFPHQLVRVMVTEQLYRALAINQGSKYHHT